MSESHNTSKKIIILCGPTGVGKSELALAFAKELNAEIVSADAGQVYQGFDIGTAKPSAETQQQIRHHCIDLWEPTVHSDANLWAQAADEAIADIAKRGKRVLVVGGTGLYIRALLYGLFVGPASDLELRNRLQDEFDANGGESLHARLSEVDPTAAARIHPNDPVRLIRALEVYQLTGEPISQQQKEHGFHKRRYPYIMIGLDRERAELYRRINERVVNMIEAGWREEAEALYRRWGGDVPPFQLIGYRVIRAVLSGERSSEQLIPDIQQATRHYAKRQLTWFRAEPEIEWVDAGGDSKGLIRSLKSKANQGVE